MGSFSIWHWLIVLVFFVGFYLIPMWIIIKRIGKSPALSLLLLVPGVSTIVLWYLALAKWPTPPPQR